MIAFDIWNSVQSKTFIYSTEFVVLLLITFNWTSIKIQPMNGCDCVKIWCFVHVNGRFIQFLIPEATVHCAKALHWIFHQRYIAYEFKSAKEIRYFNVRLNRAHSSISNQRRRKRETRKRRKCNCYLLSLTYGVMVHTYQNLSSSLDTVSHHWDSLPSLRPLLTRIRIQRATHRPRLSLFVHIFLCWIFALVPSDKLAAIAPIDCHAKATQKEGRARDECGARNKKSCSFPTRDSVMLESVSLLHWNRTIFDGLSGSTDNEMFGSHTQIKTNELNSHKIVQQMRSLFIYANHSMYCLSLLFSMKTIHCSVTSTSLECMERSTLIFAFHAINSILSFNSIIYLDS